MRSRRCLAGFFRKCPCDHLPAWLKPVSDAPTLDLSPGFRDTAFLCSLIVHCHSVSSPTGASFRVPMLPLSLSLSRLSALARTFRSFRTLLSHMPLVRANSCSSCSFSRERSLSLRWC